MTVSYSAEEHAELDAYERSKVGYCLCWRLDTYASIFTPRDTAKCYTLIVARMIGITCLGCLFQNTSHPRLESDACLDRLTFFAAIQLVQHRRLGPCGSHLCDCGWYFS